MPPTRPVQERIAEKIEPDTNGGCWLWTASLNNAGYAQLSTKNIPDRVHRIMWTLRHGPIPDGLCVLHRCMADRIAKGRHGPNVKLAMADVLEIRGLAATNPDLSHREIAGRFSVSRTTVSGIVAERTWRNLL